MTDGITPRLALPLLQAGQAQKEITHNEALAALDMLIQASVEAFAVNDPPEAPVAGQCWIVGSSPAGAWAGQAFRMAAWTDGGWRFAEPPDGTQVWVIGSSAFALFSAGSWTLGHAFGRLIIDGVQVVGPRVAPIPQPSDGATIDAEARASIEAILAALQGHGLIATA